VERVATYAEHGRAAGNRHGGVYLHTDGTSFERFLVARTLLLPFVPDPIDHLKTMRVNTIPLMEMVMESYRVMKEEEWICEVGISTRKRPRLGPSVPLGDHFCPPTQSGGCNPFGHVPDISPPRMIWGPG